MTSPSDRSEFLRELAARSAATDGVFWTDDGHLAVLEPHLARRLSSANWRGLSVPDRLVDVLCRRSSPEVRWARIRSAWLSQVRQMSTADQHRALIARMSDVLSRHQGRDVDAVLLAQRVMVEPVLPMVLAGLTERESRQIHRYLHRRARWVLGYDVHDTIRSKARVALRQLHAGLLLRRVLRQRASGRRPRQADLTDPFVDLRAELGTDRCLNIVSGVLVAISGPPGAAAACLLYELARQSAWFERLSEELSAVDQAAFCAAPAAAAPLTHRFVKEVLRCWSVPAFLPRVARSDHEIAGFRLAKGQTYLLSPNLIHRDPRVWRDPEVFDPDRFLPGAARGPVDRDSYVPFGWPPRHCVGADLGTTQLLALCLLLCTRFRMVAPGIDQLEMSYRFAPLPIGMRAQLLSRS